MRVCVEIGYWNERRGYVSTAVYRPVVEEFYGLQNRTYVVTTILVGLGLPLTPEPAEFSLSHTHKCNQCVHRKLPT